MHTHYLTIRCQHHKPSSSMSAVLKVESTLTDRYQTTVPETVRRALCLGKRDKLHYTIRQDGEVVLSRAPADDDDPALVPFLTLLAQDIAEHPERLSGITAARHAQIQSLVGDIELDLDRPLSADDE